MRKDLEPSNNSMERTALRAAHAGVRQTRRIIEMSPEFVQAVGVLKDFVLALAAIWTATVATRGVSAWRREARWKDDREVARQLTRAVLKTQDAFRRVRSPWYPPSEFPEGWDEKRRTPGGEYEVQVYVHNARLSLLGSALTELEGASLEATVLWGDAPHVLMKDVRSCGRRLAGSIEDHLLNIRSGHRELRENRDEWERVRSDIWGSGDETDHLSLEIAAATDAMLEFARMHLGR